MSSSSMQQASQDAPDSSDSPQDSDSDNSQGSAGYTICIKVDGQGDISVGVTPASADDGDEDDDSSDYAPAKNIKDALTVALDIYRNDGQVKDSDADFNEGYSSQTPPSNSAPSTYAGD